MFYPIGPMQFSGKLHERSSIEKGYNFQLTSILQIYPH